MRVLSALRRRLGLHVCRVMVRELGSARRTRAPEGADLEFRALRACELLRWCRDPALELEPEQVRAAWLRGDRCLGALHGERLVGYLWLAYGPTPHTDGLWVEFHPDARYSYKKFVLPDYRGKRTAHGLSALADSDAFTRGRRFAINFVALENRASLKATRRSGSRTVGYAGYLRWGAAVIAFRSRGARAYGFRFLALENHGRHRHTALVG